MDRSSGPRKPFRPPQSPGTGPDASPPPGQRRALSQVGGAIQVRGTPASAAPLRDALEGLEQAPSDLLTHGFHTYPARLHPLLVRHVLERYALPGEVVLDPFTGGGTTPVEAMLRGCQALGTDINPIALRIAGVRTLCWPDDRIDALIETARALSDAAFQDARRKVRHAPGPAALRQKAWYSPHVLIELQGLYDRILSIDDPELREVALMVFSSILLKVSRQVSDSRQATTERQIGRGTASKLFGRKAEELGQRLKDLAAAVPPGTPAPLLRQADARALPGREETVDLVVTSPPYAGTYDYASHQDRRFDWLDEDPTFARHHEIGTRSGSHPDTSPRGGGYEARLRWRDDEQAFLSELARVLKPGGRIFIVAGDGLIGGEPWLVDREIVRSADVAGLRLLAIASQDRPHFNRRAEAAFAGRPRREHLIHLRKGGGG